MGELISVIIPVYNVERYLPACLESVLNQDYKELEILLIDDGSPDESGRICDEYARKDDRIRVFHQKNTGAGGAKNTGLRAATGYYLTFLDGDDFLEPGSLSYMVRLMEELAADVVQCDLQHVYRNSVKPLNSRHGIASYTATDYLVRFTKDWTCALMTDKLFKRKLFDGIFFEEGNKIDDEYFTYQGVMNAAKVVTDDRIVYNYRQRASSVMQSPASQERIMLDRIDCLEKRRIKVLERFPQLRRVYDLQYLETLIFFTRHSWASEESISLVQVKLRAYFRESGWTMPPFPVALRILFTCTATMKILLNRRLAPAASADPAELFD